MGIFINQQPYECPCKNCEERTINCHSSCKEYGDWVKEKERIKQEIKQQKSVGDNSGWNYYKSRKRKDK